MTDLNKDEIEVACQLSLRNKNLSPEDRAEVIQGFCGKWINSGIFCFICNDKLKQDEPFSNHIRSHIKKFMVYI
jgi:hypothetical protein